MLRICLLGPFRVERDGREIPSREWARPKDRALLKLLALDRGRLVPQDRLLDALWPDLEPAAAARSLHVAVSRLRKLLGPAPLIRRDAAGYTLAATDAVWLDVEEFRRLLGQGREWRRRGAWAPAAQAYRAAAALYRGELCEDDPYAEWALRPREQLREAHLALLEELAECLLHVGAPAEAIELCERGLAQDRTREALYAQLMRAHGAAGHIAEGLQAYERCRRALAEDLGVDPGPAVRAAHAQLLRDDGPGAAPPSGAPTAPTTAAAAERGAPASRPLRDGLGRLHLPCVGREGELAELVSHLDAARAGQGRLVLLHGEPGIGKSRLLEEFGRLAASRGARALTARCYELERDLPYAPIADALGRFLRERADPAEVAPALGPWGPQLTAVLPSLRDLVPGLPRHQPLRPDAERSALLAGLTHLLSSLGRSAPLALLLDDLHWADASTVQWLHYLARRLGGAPVLVVGTYRSGEVGPDHPLQLLLESLAGDPVAPPPLELPCLGAAQVAALLPAVSGSATRGRALAARLHRETDGHPLFLIETLRTLLETGVLRLDEPGGWEEADATLPAPERRLPLPPTLREAIRWRVGRLNERERRVLLAAAVVARGFRPEPLARMTELTPDAVLDTLEALVARQLVRLAPTGSGFDFRHDLIQQVVYADLGPDRRRVLHTRAAEALEAHAEGRPPAARELAGELAHHWRQAERWAPACRYAVLAGDHAREASAPREALAHYRRAAELAERQPVPLEPDERAGLLERLGRAYADLGEFDAAVRQFAALRALARALADRPLEGRALLALADAHYWRHEFVPAERLAAEALGRAEELGHRGLRAGSLATAASVAMAQGRAEDAERHCGAVLALAGARPPVGGGEEPVVAAARLNALGWLGLLREFQGDHERALPAIDASLRLGRELHNPFLTGRSRFALGMSLGNRGRYEDALATLHGAFRLAEEGGDRYFLPRLPNTIGWVYSELGDLGQAEEWNRRSIALARETGWLEAEANALVNLGGDALRAGQRARARELFQQAAALIDRDAWFTWRYRMRLLVGLGELALSEGVPERALTFAQQALAVADPTGSRKHAGRARLLRGRAMLAAGAPPAEALAQLERARSLARAAGHPPLLWTSARELAVLHAHLGHETEAAACLAEARAAVEAVAEGIGDPALRRCFLGADTLRRALADA
ncbi:MAG TPA: AAA family ATPase [Thermomicrobiales bacterium]|nr:AAA family ATPase [Thermomicrobiales bacterium]